MLHRYHLTTTFLAAVPQVPQLVPGISQVRAKQTEHINANSTGRW